MTAAEAKRDLPDVPIRVGRKVYQAKVSGRLNAQATVTVSYITHGAPRHHLRGNPWRDWHFSWEAVARAVTTREPLDGEA